MAKCSPRQETEAFDSVGLVLWMDQHWLQYQYPTSNFTYKYSETIQHINWVIAGSGVRQVKTGGAAASPDIRPKFFSFLTVYSEKKHQN